jgi:hypothetical protein
MYWTKTTKISGTNLVGIGFGGNMNGLGNRIEGNTIGYANANGTGTSVLDATGATVKFFVGLKNTTCKNNKVANIEMSGNNINGFEFGASNASTPNADDVCYGNVVENVKLMTTGAGTFAAFWINYANPYDMNIKNNVARNLSIENKTGNNLLKIYGFQATGTNVAGKVHKFIGNEVSNLSSGLGTLPSTTAGDVYGIRVYIVDLIEKNLIYNLNANPQAYIRGLRIEGNNANPIVFRNNIMRIGTEVTGNVNIIAIQYNSSSALNMYHNTVYLGGTCASDAPVTLVTRILSFFTTSPILTLQNNIFMNKRSGGLSLNSVLLTSAGKVAASDHNLYDYSGEFFNNGTSYADFAAWKLAMPALESGSLDKANPLFVDATSTTPDMHMPSSSPANMGGVPIATVTDDFAGAIRADYTPADLGAYVIAGSTALETPAVVTRNVYSANGAIVFNNLCGCKASIYSLSGQLVKTLTLNSDSYAMQIEKGFYMVNAEGENVKIMVK